MDTNHLLWYIITMTFWSSIISTPPTIEYAATNFFIPEETYRFYVPDLWSLNLYNYFGIAIFNGVKYDLAPGCVCIIPPGQTREFIVSAKSEHRVIHFHTSRRPRGLTTHKVVLNNPTEVHLCHERIVTAWSHQPQQARAEFWKLLWDLHDIAHSTASSSAILPPPLRRALEIIEANLHLPLRVHQLAGKCDLSINHLICLSKNHLGMPLASYIRSRRLQRIDHLLSHTNMPIKSIAYEVGIPDLQAFNKFVRKAHAMSPRAWRKHICTPAQCVIPASVNTRQQKRS